MRRLPLLLSYMLFVVLMTMGAKAHEMRPAYLEITANDAGVQILWKEPLAPGRPTLLRPIMSTGWLTRAPDRRIESEGSAISEWKIVPGVPLEGIVVSVEGLERTVTDALVRLKQDDAPAVTQVLRAGNASFTLPAQGRNAAGLPGFIRLGVEHILTGFDHLLFISTLLLLVSGWRRWVATITAFTIGHSLTLTAVVLGLVQVNPAFVECLIALSVLILAVEVVLKARGRPSFAARASWVVAVGFGLLHGLGFAGALLETGIPRSEIAAVLFGFNIGVELGQLAFVAAVLMVVFLLRRAVTLPVMPHMAAAYAIGAIAAYWLFERLGTYAG